jgi:two-component system LytT family response regulator
MIKTVIIEDEPKVKESLVYLLEKYCSDLQICGVAGTFEEAYSLVNTHKPQLIFADIQLNSPEGTGIDLGITRWKPSA